MAESGSKRRSARQLAGRKRSIYYEPDTDEELYNFDQPESGDDDEQGVFTPEPEAGPSRPQRPKKKRRIQRLPQRETRLKVKSKERWHNRRKDAKPRKTKKYSLARPPPTPSKKKAEKMAFRGPSDGKIPDWTSLPIEILRDIFIFASQPMHPMLESNEIAKANKKWLIKEAAQTCRTFATPALEAYYHSPVLLSSVAPHSLLELLRIPKDQTYIDYAVKVKRLEIDVRMLSYKATDRAVFNLSSLAKALPRLQHLEIIHPVDLPPFRRVNVPRWKYPVDLIDSLFESNVRLKSFRWNREMTTANTPQMLYERMTNCHRTPSLEYLERLVICGYDNSNSAEPLPVQHEGVTYRAAGLASSISLLRHLKDLTFISCDVVMDDFLERLPKTLERLELSNCLEVTSDMLTSYLAQGGSQLRELVLNHNPALNLSFVQYLKTSCPRLEVLKMDLTYYSERFNYNDAWALYDQLLTTAEVPQWPPTLRHLELLNLQKWEADAAQVFFRSLVDEAQGLMALRHLVIQTHINIPWRDRVGFRDEWIDRFRKVFLRKEEDPNPNLGSLKQFRLWKDAQNNRKGLTATPPRSMKPDDEDSDYGAPARRRLSHVRITPRKALASADTYSDEESTPEKRHPGRPRRSVRVAESQSATAAEESDSDSEQSEPEQSRDAEPAFIQGLCRVVEISIDNQRPREHQYTEGEFLDSERSGDEDWHSGAELSDDGYAW